MTERGDQEIHDGIRARGWHIVSVPADEDGPAFAFTIGLFETFGHPEVIVVGLEAEIAREALDRVGAAIARGARFRAGDRPPDLAPGYEIGFADFPVVNYGEYLEDARRYYGGDEFPALECVWTNRDNRFPWHAGSPGPSDEFPTDFDELENTVPLPFAGDTVRPWPFADAEDTIVFTTRQVLEGTPVVRVSHDVDGAWQFHSSEVSTSDARTLGLGEIVQLDPSLLDLSNLPHGWVAHRAAPGRPWARRRARDYRF